MKRHFKVTEKTPKAADIGFYLIEKIGPTPTQKFHILLYYGQAWSLVWDKKPIFREKITAWRSGPVIEDLITDHEDRFTVHLENLKEFTSGQSLEKDQQETIDVIIKEYGDFSSQYLSDLCHMERPWNKAQAAPDRTIDLREMYRYYRSL